MRRTLQRNFVVTAMIAVTVLLAVLLGAINAVNAWTSRTEIERQLDMLCDTRRDFDPAEGQTPPDFAPFRRAGGRERMTLGPASGAEMLFTARYYLVWADESGEITAVDGTHIEYASEEEAASLFAAASGILHDETRRREMARSMAALGVRDATERIYETVTALL